MEPHAQQNPMPQLPTELGISWHAGDPLPARSPRAVCKLAGGPRNRHCGSRAKSQVPRYGQTGISRGQPRVKWPWVWQICPTWTNRPSGNLVVGSFRGEGSSGRTWMFPPCDHLIPKMGHAPHGACASEQSGFIDTLELPVKRTPRCFPPECPLLPSGHLSR